MSNDIDTDDEDTEESGSTCHHCGKSLDDFSDQGYSVSGNTICGDCTRSFK